MVSWKCEHCGENMHSACAEREKENVVCIGCGKEFKNPYFEGVDFYERGIRTENSKRFSMDKRDI